jgi:acetate kinase
VDVYVHRLSAQIAAMTASLGGLGGLDALVFTGGVGEHAPRIRHRAGERLAFLGVMVDPHRNDHARSDANISAPAADVQTLVVTAREDLEVAAGTRKVLAGRRGNDH